MFPTPFRFAHTLAHQMPDVCRTLLYPNFGINLDRFWEFTFVGGFSPTLSGEIGLSEIRIVFAEVSICPERTELLQRSLRETHFEATVTRFEFTRRISRIPGGPARLAQAPNSPGWPRLPIVQAGPTLISSRISRKNSKPVTVASKLASRSVAGFLFILSERICTITKPFRETDRANSPTRRP